jgi:hypothetical protein
MLLSGAAAVSCSVVGYSAVLWEAPELGLSDGDVVPVYRRSALSGTYLVAAGEAGRAEVPQWKLSTPASRRNARKRAAECAGYRYRYAESLLDGLPVRKAAAGAARTVYRLRRGEVLKPLFAGEGEAVTDGRARLEGEWLRVLTGDGTLGWCFSHSLRLFDVRQGGAAEEDAAETDEALETVLSKDWYPEEYGRMLQNKAIDLERMKAEYGFRADREAGTVTLRFEGLDAAYPFGAIEKLSASRYRFDGAPVTLAVRDGDHIAVTHTDARGMPALFNCITLPVPVEELIEGEQVRREEAYRRLFELGPVFASEHYGTLALDEGGAFSWDGYGLLSPAIIPQGAGGGGTVALRYLASGRLPQYTGVLTFRFEDAGRDAHFFYTIEENGVRLEDTTGVQPRNGVFSSRAASPVVAFFAASGRLNGGVPLIGNDRVP